MNPNAEIKDAIEIFCGDITRLPADAIVNAGNKSLLGGGGVDGAIHRAAGPQLLNACKKLHGCPTGEAKMTPGYRLGAKYVIHTVGPVWHGGGNREAELLAACYKNSLRLANTHRFHSIAFPAISTGVYGYPFEKAGLIALFVTFDFLKRNRFPEKVIFVLFSRPDYEIFRDLYENLYAGKADGQ